MGQCASRPKDAQALDAHSLVSKQDVQLTRDDGVPADSAKLEDAKAGAAVELSSAGAVKAAAAVDVSASAPEAVCNPDTSLILNMLDPENGPAAGLPYQVHHLGPPRPPCEVERLATLAAIEKNEGGEADPEISSILRLVASVFKAPAALCALFEEKRVFISEQEGNVVPSGDFPWRWTLCGWSMAFKNPQVLVIPDTYKDVRFTSNPKCMVSPGVRFYCGAPLIASNGHRLGTLCFADVKPRVFDAASCVMMNNMSELVVRQLEKGIALKLREKGNQELARTYAQLHRTMDCFDHCVVLLDTSVPGWRVAYANASWTRYTGLPRDSLVGALLSDTLEVTDGTKLPSAALLAAVEKNKSQTIRMARVKDPNITKTFTLQFRPAGQQGFDDQTITLGVPSFLPQFGGEDVAQRFYFMTLSPVGSARTSVISSTIAPSVSLTYSSTSSEGSVEGLDLGHLLGRGSFGWVYFGTYFGSSVAVKVIDDDVAKPSGSPGSAEPNFEALLTKELRHPNIVATLKYMTRSVPMGRPPTWEDYAAGSQRNSNKPLTSGAKQSLRALSAARGSQVDSSSQFPTSQTDMSASAYLSAGRNTIDSFTAGQAGGCWSEVSGSVCGRLDDAFSSQQGGLETIMANGWAVIDVGALGEDGNDSNDGQPGWAEEEEAEEGNAAADADDVRILQACRAKPDQLPGGGPSSTPLAAGASAGARSRLSSVTNSAAVNAQLWDSDHGREQGDKGSAMATATGLMTSDFDSHVLEPGGKGSFTSTRPGGQGARHGSTSGSTASNVVAYSASSLKQTWLIMEFCDKGCVQDAVDRGWLRIIPDCVTSQPNMVAVICTAMEIASAMRYLHSLGIVHGDLTGWNVMLSSTGPNSHAGNRGFVAKVADFGMARNLDLRARITTKTYGTLTHMPPEVLMSGHVSKAMDVYSFGVLLWQMYTGSRPWSGLNHAQIVLKVVQQNQKLQWPEDTPPMYQQLAQDCMLTDAAARPGFDAVVERLDAIRSWCDLLDE